MKLSDRSVWNHIFPITNLKDIESITIVRDVPGPEMMKVRYVTPRGKRTTSSILRFPIRLGSMIRFSKMEKPILVHSYLLFPHGYLTFLAGKLTGRKIGVSLIAGPVEVFILGGSPIGNYAYCNPLPHLTIFCRLTLSLLKKFDIITVTGTYTRNFLISKGIESNKILVLPHVVDERFRPMDVEKEYDLVYIGRLTPVKHVETLIRATAEVEKSLPSIRVAIVGDGEERNGLEILAVSLGLSKHIDFVGYQANAWEWYNRSRLSVLTSEREGLPYSVIESLNCGVPTIVSDCGDVNDVVKDSYNGRIVQDYRDYRAYAHAIIELLTQPEILEEYSRNCLETIDHSSSSPIESVWMKIVMMMSRK